MTANHLTRKQKRDAHTLLYEYTNLFAKSDSDLGRTDIIRHKIDTGTTRPVKIPTMEECTPTLQRKLINI